MTQWLRGAALACAGALLFSAAASAGPQYVNADGAALSGYDAVAYHTVGEPTEGDAAFTHEYNGATWRFASAENRDLFSSAPEQYAPAFDGHCSWAASQGYKARGNPQAWRIVDGVLYVNYNQTIQERWEHDIPGFITAATENWPALGLEEAAEGGSDY